MSMITYSPSNTTKLRRKTQSSPSRHNTHGIYNVDKLKVYIKFKPCQQQDAEKCVKYVNEKQVQVKNALATRQYIFDHVFSQNCPLESMFNSSCQKIVEEVFWSADRGSKNGLVFFYGNTGTGKTYSMGLLENLSKQSHGIVPDSLRHVFKLRGSRPDTSVFISFTQIYLDEIHDLLNFQSQTKLSVRENTTTRETYIEDQISIQVDDLEEAFQLINIGLQKRRVAQQRLNKKSSRGHGLITVYFGSQKSKGKTQSKLCFVDLAGCQRIKESESTGSVFNQAVHINSSLSALEALLISISEQRTRSYRGNKLTRLLQPYFQKGEIKLFITSNYCSLQTIEFAKRCKGIKFYERELTPRTSQKPLGEKKDKLGNQQPSKSINGINAREKKLFQCIGSLVAIINKLSETISDILKSQTIGYRYKLPQFCANQSVQQQLNLQITELEKREEEILEKSDTTLPTSINPILLAEATKNPQELQVEAKRRGFQIAESMKHLACLNEYRNSYKKEIFAGSLKNHLLTGKNKQFEDAINCLLKSFDRKDTNALQTLRKLGVLFSKENFKDKDNCPRLSAKQNSRDYSKPKLKLPGQSHIKTQEPQQNHGSHSDKKNLIYIAE